MTFDLAARLGLCEPTTPVAIEIERAPLDDCVRTLVEYEGDAGDAIRAYLFVPKAASSAEPRPGVVAFHQHAGQWHLGKSEVAGLAGDPLHAFGPALASRGFVVLAPDAITFEDRRPRARGTVEAQDDWLQHYNEHAYRLVRGDTLMRKVLDDAQRAVSVLLAQPCVDAARLASFGHSFGGTTALYHSFVDGRVRRVCASGAGASYRGRMAAGTGLGMVEIVPGLAERVEFSDLLAATKADSVLVVWADGDEYSQDAGDVVREARARAPVAKLEHLAFEGGHELDADRVSAIVDWLSRPWS